MEKIELKDLLFRSPAYSKSIKLRNFFKDKRILITGAGGSIGSEIARQIASFKPENLILFERHEENLYKIDKELSNLNIPNSSFTSIIGDIIDGKRIAEVIKKFQPDILLHAAAYKHIILMENNPYEAFKINVIGTKVVAEKAKKYGVKRFVLLSTDKAVNPLNIMGMTKKIAEDIVRCFSKDSKVKRYKEKRLCPSIKYITVRFGNVIGSSGSVIPLFNEQIKKGGPVTITHPEITRYFITISEAASFVLHATAMGSNGGEVFVPDMGKPVKILDLAKKMISLYGYRHGNDVKISFIGLRPGEKLHEELFNNDELIEKTSHQKINRAISKRKVNQKIIKSLNNPVHFKNDSDIRNILKLITK